MVDNFLQIFDIGAELEKLPQKKVEENLVKIVGDIHSRKHRTVDATLGGKMGPIMTQNIKGAQKYIVNDSCNQCGICTKVCPTGNIEVADNVVFSDHCAGCLACVHLCPQNAIHLKNEKSAKRWHNLDVSLSEIIAANNRLNTAN